ncbi:MAG: nucleotidyl transferase AbiEii/AbiGii toxin family protein [Thermomicrobiales bacterium]
MKYASSGAFRTALEQRLAANADGKPANYLNRHRKMIVFDRYLARLSAVAPGKWVLKGGIALSLRLVERSRTTLDLDLASDLAENDVVDTLIDAADLELGDHFTFLVEKGVAFPAEERGEVLRFRLIATLAGRHFETVAIDINLSEPLPKKTETVRASTFFDSQISRRSRYLQFR